MHLFMRIFTRLTASCLVIVIAASMVSCTTGQGGHTSAGLSISLTSDKDAIFADGADAVTFTVIDNSSREDVTSASVIYMLSEDGSSSQTSASFSTETPGSYTWPTGRMPRASPCMSPRIPYIMTAVTSP